jgi:Phosphatidylglycerol lysyltransferase, C-terminal
VLFKPLTGEPLANMARLEVCHLATLNGFYSYLIDPPADLNPLMMVAWRKTLDLHLLIACGALYVVAKRNGSPVLWGPPAGPNLTFKHLSYGFGLLRAIGGPSVQPSILYVWEGYPLWTEILNAMGLRVNPHRTEYLYRVTDIAQLNAPKLRKKRQERARFGLRYRPEVLPYEGVLAGDCIDLVDRWAEHKRPRVPGEFRDKFEIETSVCRAAFADELKMQGVVARIAGRVEAFSVGMPHTVRCFNCMFEKTNTSLSGASSFIFSELARITCRNYAEIDAGDDWDVPYLAKAKNDWQPCRLRQAFCVAEASDFDHLHSITS